MYGKGKYMPHDASPTNILLHISMSTWKKAQRANLGPGSVCSPGYMSFIVVDCKKMGNISTEIVQQFCDTLRVKLMYLLIQRYMQSAHVIPTIVLWGNEGQWSSFCGKLMGGRVEEYLWIPGFSLIREMNCMIKMILFLHDSIFI